MNTKKIHNILGLILLLPLLGWISTGVVFLIKPGYAAAYEQISPKLYAIDTGEPILPNKSWLEMRLFKTILGDHLLVNIDGQWQHLNAKSFLPQAAPTAEQEILLLSDAIRANQQRYGAIETRKDNSYITSTGVELSLDWNTLRIYQKGYDTQLINTLYKIHYLQWLGNTQANKLLAIVGLSLLTLLMCYGVILSVRRRKQDASF